MPVTVGALILLGVVLVGSIVNSVRGGVFWESFFEVLGHVLLIILEFVLIFGFIIWVLGNMINVW